MKTKVFFMFFALTMMSVSLYAQTAKSTSTKQETQKSCYVDANNNGVCDNYENKTCKKENGKRDGKGNCANKGKGDCCKVETKKSYPHSKVNIPSRHSVMWKTKVWITLFLYVP